MLGIPSTQSLYAGLRQAFGLGLAAGHPPGAEAAAIEIYFSLVILSDNPAGKLRAPVASSRETLFRPLSIRFPSRPRCFVYQAPKAHKPLFSTNLAH